MKFGTEWKSESWKCRAGSDVRFWDLDVFFKTCNPAEMLSLRKIRKLGITGWEQPLFMELCCFSKNVIGKHVSHMKNQQGGKSGLGATFVSGILRLFQKRSSELNVVQKEDPHVGTSVAVATFVSGILLFLKKCAPNWILPRRKSRKWERAGR